MPKNGLQTYYQHKLEQLDVALREKQQNVRRLEAQRNDWNAKGTRLIVFLIRHSALHKGRVAKAFRIWLLCRRGGKTHGKEEDIGQGTLFFNVLLTVQVHPEGKYVVDLSPKIDLAQVTPTTRIALRNDSYELHMILPNKVREFL